MADLKYMKAVEYDALPSLFKKAFPLLTLGPRGYWLQRKYDGCFGKAIITKRLEDCRMESREGKDYTPSCTHILGQLHSLAEGDTFAILGEVWKKGVSFPDISGRFRRQSAGSQDIDFVINDVLDPRMETLVPYKQRFEVASEFVLEGMPQDNIRLAETYEFWDDTAGPLPHAIRWKNEGGYDGAILRNPSAGYTFGKVKDGAIIKVKPVLSLDIRCLGYAVETGEKTGRPVYTIRVEYRGVITAVGSGVPHAFQNVPKLGQIVQIDSMGLTEDGRLREPRFITIRHDKSESDQ
jgi:DNA ligase-1